jgi:hypothetical protein
MRKEERFSRFSRRVKKLRWRKLEEQVRRRGGSVRALVDACVCVEVRGGGKAQVGAGREAFEIVNARQLFAVEGDMSEAQQQLSNLHSNASKSAAPTAAAVTRKCPTARGLHTRAISITSSAPFPAVCCGVKHLLLMSAIVIDLGRDGAAAATFMRWNDGTIMSSGSHAVSSTSSPGGSGSRAAMRRVVTCQR